MQIPLPKLKELEISAFLSSTILIDFKNFPNLEIFKSGSLLTIINLNFATKINIFELNLHENIIDY